MVCLMNYFFVVVIVLLFCYGILCKYSMLVWLYYLFIFILVNFVGICVFIEYNFWGGECWYWIDFYCWFLLVFGDVFYMIIDLCIGKIIWDFII